jgi:hypothetical protein
MAGDGSSVFVPMFAVGGVAVAVVEVVDVVTVLDGVVAAVDAVDVWMVVVESVCGSAAFVPVVIV